LNPETWFAILWYRALSMLTMPLKATASKRL
jgi:hypothetical protein